MDDRRRNYFNLTSELKTNLLNVWVTVIPIVVGALGMVPKGLEKFKIRESLETILTTVLQTSARINRRVLEI